MLMFGISFLSIGNQSDLYAVMAVDTDIGFVNEIGDDIIVIDDFLYKLATNVGRIGKGDYVKVFLDDHDRVIKIEKMDAPEESVKENNKTKINKIVKSDFKKAKRNGNKASLGSKIKKIDGVWRNY